MELVHAVFEGFGCFGPEMDGPGEFDDPVVFVPADVLDFVELGDLLLHLKFLFTEARDSEHGFRE